MVDEIKVKIITKNDLLDSGCFNIPEVIDVVEETLKKYNPDNIYFPDKISYVFDEDKQNRINCLPAGFADEKIYGVKWVSVFPENPYKYGKPNVSAVNILSELQTGFPIAFIDGTLESNLRTAAIGAVGARYLAPSHPEIIGFIGAGEQAKFHFLTMKHVFPSIKICKVSSRTSKTENQFIDILSDLYPDVKFVSCNGSYENAVKDADIIITAISGQEKILKADWIKKPSFYCHVAGLEDEYDVAKMADKIVVDSWDVVKHRTQTISRMYKEGLLTDNDIYADLHEIVKGLKKGRELDDEFIYFNSVGLSFIDTAVTNYMYRKVSEKGLGFDIPLSSKIDFRQISDKIVL